jgi:multicomponent Na+:H+ antiporter subunit B
VNARWRWIMIVTGCAGLLVLVTLGLLGLPGFGNYPGPYGDLVNRQAPEERQVQNAVSAVVFDYRALDTLGEEFILFGAVSGLVLLLRGRQGEQIGAAPLPPDDRALTPRSEAIHLIGFGAVGALVLFGIYIVLHGHLSPGGGFQGGAMTGTALLMVYLATDYVTYRRTILKPASEFLESLGGAGYVLVGIASLLAGGAFLQNFLPFGTRGHFFSGGTIPLINFAVGLEVAGGFGVLFSEFLEETRALGKDEEK